jgi:ABC-type transport system involved in cytochrome bd biosynthesis fused ATPase/permease subunit
VRKRRRTGDCLAISFLLFTLGVLLLIFFIFIRHRTLLLNTFFSFKTMNPTKEKIEETDGGAPKRVFDWVQPVEDLIRSVYFQMSYLEAREAYSNVIKPGPTGLNMLDENEARADVIQQDEKVATFKQ